MITLGKHFCSLRNAHGLTIADLAAATGLSASVISRVENGTVTTTQSVYRLCRYYGVGLDKIASLLVIPFGTALAPRIRTLTSLGEYLRFMRKSSVLTIADLAKLSGISRSPISRVERGETDIGRVHFSDLVSIDKSLRLEGGLLRCVWNYLETNDETGDKR